MEEYSNFNICICLFPCPTLEGLEAAFLDMELDWLCWGSQER